MTGAAHFAETLLGRLPSVFTAPDAGVSCRGKAWLFTELCVELTDEQAQVVCDGLLPRAQRPPTGELAAWIKKVVIALGRRSTRPVPSISWIRATPRRATSATSQRLRLRSLTV